MKKLIIILVSFYFSLLAQNKGVINGTIVDKVSKQRIQYVTVFLEGTNLGAQSNQNGDFQIKNIPPGVYNLRVSAVGYKPFIKTDVVVNNVKPTEVNIEIEETNIELKGVTVKADYFNNSVFDPVSIKKFSYEEIRRAPGGFEDVVRSLSVLPGVAQVSAGRNDIIVRGGGPAENLFVIDGFPVQNINHFGTQGASGGPLSYVNLDYVKESSFSTGGFGVNYGNKLSSILSIDLRDARKDRVGGKATISASQFGLNVEGPLSENSNLIFSARRSYLDFIFEKAGFSFVPEYYDYLTKYTHRLANNDQISFLLIGAIDRVKWNNKTLDNRYENSRILGTSQRQYLTGIKYRTFIKDGFIDFNISRNYVKYDGSQRDSNLVYIFRNNSIEQENNFNTELTYKINQRSEVITGFNIKYANTDYNIILPNFKTTYGNNISINSDVTKDFIYADFYSQYSNIVFDVLRYNFGLRLDYFSGIKNNTAFSPRFSLSYLLNPISTFSFHIGKYYQTPAYMYLATIDQNKNLKFIQADQVIFGFDHRPMMDVLVKVEFFYKRYDKYPTSTVRPYLVLSNSGAGFSGSEDNFSSYAIEPLVSLGKGESRGIEFSMQKKLSEIPLYGIFSVTYSKSEFTALDGVKRISNFDQPIIANLSGGYIFNQEWELSFKFRYANGFPYTPWENDGSQKIQNINSKRYPDRHSFDLRVDKRWFFDNFALITYVDIQNIYNRQEISYRWDSREKRVIEQKSIGILPSIGLSLEF